MSAACRRHVLVVASQRRERPLALLGQAAHGLLARFLDPDVGACAPGLPSEDALVHGELSKAQIEDTVRLAIGYAAEAGATLVLALLGHGFMPGANPVLYLMGCDSQEGILDTAVEVRRLLVEAAERPGINGVIGIIDTCTAAAAQPMPQELAVGTRAGQTRLSLLMACAAGQSAYDMNMSRQLAELLRTGVPRATERLRVLDVAGPLKAVLSGQIPVSHDIDGDSSPEHLWLTYNQDPDSRAPSPGSYGIAQLLAAMQSFRPDRVVPVGLDLAALKELRREIAGTPASAERDHAVRVVDSLIVAQRTISFLRSFMATGLSTEVLHRALAASDNAGGSSPAVTMDAELITEVDAVEYVALNYAHAERSCRPRMARFVLTLAHELKLNPDSTEMRDWAKSIEAIVAFNDALKAIQKQRTLRRLRLIVSLHHGLSGEWPEEVSAWVRDDGEFFKHRIYKCRPDQPGVESAVNNAVEWAELQALEFRIPLERIEIAVPARILLRWRPEEMRYGGELLGRNHTVLTRWSQRLVEGSEVLRMNLNAFRRVAEIAAHKGGSHLHWLATRQISERERLQEELGTGRYSPAIGLLDYPGDDADLLELLLRFVPVLLWPRAGSLGPEHCQCVDSRWYTLPEGFLTAKRAHWSAGDADLLADIRAVWDDEDWLNFCMEFQLGTE
jgi:hypothetical protein